MSGSPVRALPSIADMAIMAKKASAVAANNCSGTPGGEFLPPDIVPRLAGLSLIFLRSDTLPILLKKKEFSASISRQ